MRVIESKMVEAIKNGQFFSSDNTVVKTDGDIVSVYLHGHNIFKLNRLTNEWSFDFCGWYTNTTKSRINACLSSVAVYGYVFQKNFEMFYHTSKKDIPIKGEITSKMVS